MKYDLKGTSVFLSGPMTGIPYYNLPAFIDAHRKVVELGATRVYNPAYEWLKSALMGVNEKSHGFYMRTYIHELTGDGYWEDHEIPPKYDFVVAIGDWEKSEGSVTEVAVANACGIPVIEISELSACEEEK